MQEETQNSYQDWRKRLDDLEAVRGENPTDLSRAWEKLHIKLAPAKKGNKFVWWYVAAACVILTFLMLAFFMQPAHENIKITTTTKTNPRKIILFEPVAIAKTKSYSAKKIVSSRIKTNPPPKKTDTIISVTAPLIVSEIQSPVIVNSDTPNTQVSKKLRVVHLYELELNDTNEKQTLALQEKTKVKHTNSKKLIQSYVSNSKSDQILKINLPTSH